MLKRLLSRKSRKTSGKLSYEQARHVLEENDYDKRLELAKRSDTRPEILYYLAEDDSADVRRHIAQNPATPIHADALLTIDEDGEVRSELARKIARLVPGLTAEEQATLHERAVEVLERLAQDQLPKVRAIVAEEIKQSENVPRHIVRQLAEDVEDIVATPILEYSPLLGDDDLREIIAAGASEAALVAIARRPTVSEPVSEAVAGTLEIPAVAALLVNPSAQIREDTLDQIIDQAKEVQDLHEPLATRPDLSIRAMKRIAGFVASALVHTMIESSALAEDVAEDILERVRERIAAERVGEDDEKRFAEEALKLHKEAQLNDDFVVEAIESNQRELLIQCLALMAELPAKTVREILKSKSGRAVSALAWKARLTMRTAYAMQTKLALVPAPQLVTPKAGIDYPLDTDEMIWHLSYFSN